MFRLFRSQYYAASDNTGGASGSAINEKPSDKEDIIKFLGDDDNEPEVNKDKEALQEKPKLKTDENADKEEDTNDGDEDKDEDEDNDDDKKDEEELDELKLLEEELEEPTEEDLEFVTPVRRAEIIKEFPIWKEIIKKFPYLEKAYFREREFTEIYPTPADARESKEKADTLDKFEQDLINGDIEKILQFTKGDHPRSFNKLVDNYLDVLSRVDERAYDHVTGNIISHTIAAMAREAKRSNNEELLSAASILNQFIFRTTEYRAPSRLTRDGKPEDNEREEALSRKEQEFDRRQFEIARNNLNTRVNNSIESYIAENIDPKKTMTDYVRRNAIRDAKETLINLVERDVRFRAIKDRLWDKAHKEGYSQKSQDDIRSAHLSKAKTLLPAVIKRARIEALRGMGKRIKEDNDEEKDRRGPVKLGKPESQQQGKLGKIKSAKDIPRGMSTLEFLNSD